MDDAILIHLDRDGDRWTALAHAAEAGTTGLLRDARILRVADGPASVLEAIGQELDGREAHRLSALARGDEDAPLSVDEAVERVLIPDVADVVEVLETEQARAVGSQPLVMTTLNIARRAGFTDTGAVDEVAAIAARARRALQRAAADGMVVRVLAGDLELWRVATDDELEDDARTAARDDARGEVDR